MGRLDDGADEYRDRRSNANGKLPFDWPCLLEPERGPLKYISTKIFVCSFLHVNCILRLSHVIVLEIWMEKAMGPGWRIFPIPKQMDLKCKFASGSCRSFRFIRWLIYNRGALGFCTVHKVLAHFCVRQLSTKILVVWHVFHYLQSKRFWGDILFVDSSIRS